jgi:two-component system chemotaxis response regulator CheB
VSRDEARLARRGKSGDPIALTCPECGGALAEKSEGPLLSFRCHTGHAFTGESLTVRQNDTIEAAFWSAIRALEEAADIRRRMARRTRAGRLTALAQAYDERAEEAERQAEVLRRLLIDGTPADAEDQKRSARKG